jgi:hypothetical protein
MVIYIYDLLTLYRIICSFNVDFLKQQQPNNMLKHVLFIDLLLHQ